MTGIRQVKTTFTAGQVSRSLLGRGDLQAYQNGALTLHNVFIQPTGGVTRRAGLRYIDTAAGDGRLVAFEFSTEQVYLLVLSDSAVMRWWQRSQHHGRRSISRMSPGRRAPTRCCWCTPMCRRRS